MKSNCPPCRITGDKDGGWGNEVCGIMRRLSEFIFESAAFQALSWAL